MATVGFIGLGMMGLQMTRCLMGSGHRATVFDIARGPVEELVGAGAKKAGSAREAAEQSEFVISMLPTPAVTREVMLGKDGIVDAFRPGTIYIDMSTSDPFLSKEICRALEQRGAEMLDAPVSGGVKGAAEGTLAIMVGGKKEVFDKAEPLLRCMGKNIFYVGNIGSGDTMKLINNMLFSVVMAATSEALALAEKNGIDPAVLREVVNNSSGRSYAMEVKVRDFVLPRNFNPGFTVDLQVKDVDLALKLGKDSGVPLVLATLVRQFYQTLLMRGQGKKDTSIIVTFFEELMGIKKEA